LINNYRSIILKSLQEAESRLFEAEKNLSFATKNFESAKIKSEEVRKQGLLLSASTANTLLQNFERDIQRLQFTSLSIVNFEQEKITNEVLRMFFFCYILFNRTLFERFFILVIFLYF
jgi:hypothetical protein